ncbi:hypothetical protein ACT4R9_11210 [Ornithobacterium rhinotracheale]|uniref:hypothetical protein n=1 Tax=Ornithobacterium rhinotracheale TaxID=28251 RepID=UPI003FA4C793
MKVKIQLNSVNGDSIVLKQFEIHEDFVSVYLNALNEIRENYECPSLADDDLARKKTFTLELVKVNGDGEVEEWNVSDFFADEVRELVKNKLNLEGELFWIESESFYSDNVEFVNVDLQKEVKIRKNFPVALFKKKINGEKEFYSWIYGGMYGNTSFIDDNLFEQENGDILDDSGNLVTSVEELNQLEGSFTLGDDEWSWCSAEDVAYYSDLMRLAAKDSETESILCQYTDANEDILYFLYNEIKDSEREEILNECDQVVLMDNEDFIYTCLEEIEDPEESGYEFLGKEYRLR